MYESDVKKYLAEVSKYMVCPGKEKRKLLKQIKASIAEYVLANNITEFDELCCGYGSPEDIAKTCLADVSLADVKKALNRKKIFVIGVIVVLLMVLIGIVLMFVDGHEYDILYVESQIVEACISPFLFGGDVL